MKNLTLKLNHALITIIAVLSFGISYGQTTAIPDANFEQALIDLGYDTGTPDGSVPTANINTITLLYIGGSNISNLTGIEDFTSLLSLYCGYMNLTDLDLTQNQQLKTLYCPNNQINNLTLANNCGFDTLYCPDNNLTSLDLSQTAYVTSLNCANNQLACLNLKNGNNQQTYSIYTVNNINLSCIEVDDVNYSTNNWNNTQIDAHTSFSTNCNYPLGCFSITTSIQEHTSTLNLYPNPFSTSITIELASEPHILAIYDIVGNKVREEQVSGKTIIERGDLTKGVYVLAFRSANNTYKAKVVVE